MKNRHWLLVALFAFASLAYADRGFMIPVEGRAVSNGVCGPGGQTWMFIVHFKPLVYRGSPWKDYIVTGYKCGAVIYKCSDNDCEATVSTCSVRVAGSYAGVIAKGLPERATGVRIGTAFKPRDCPVSKVPT